MSVQISAFLQEYMFLGKVHICFLKLLQAYDREWLPASNTYFVWCDLLLWESFLDADHQCHPSVNDDICFSLTPKANGASGKPAAREKARPRAEHRPTDEGPTQRARGAAQPALLRGRQRPLRPFEDRCFGARQAAAAAWR